MSKKNIDYSVYLVTDRDILAGRDLCEAVEESIKGGATVVQLREKKVSDEEFLEIAKKLKKVTDRYNIPLIINDNVKVAKLVDADGVHIGQSDEELTEARKELGDDKIIGVSATNLEEALKAEKDGADYLGIGAVFFTGSKKDINIPMGIEGLKEIVDRINIPSVAIGGVHLDNVKEVMETGTDGVAVISEILGKENIFEATKTLKEYVGGKMSKELFGNIIETIREKNPLVFHITNTVTINDCANITLAMGGSPLMSFCKEELEEILSFSSALVINIGTMEKNMRKMVVKAGKIANKLNVPVVLDPVGAGASKPRKELVENLIKEVKFAVIKGNLAEIKTIAGLENSKNRGVDSVEVEENAKEIGKNLAKKLKTVIAITGKEDIVTDGERVALINNGTAMMGKVTGTGCMTASLVGCACGSGVDYMLGAVTAVTSMGIAGEIAEGTLLQSEGNGSLRVKILDNIFNMTKERFLENEKITLENF